MLKVELDHNTDDLIFNEIYPNVLVYKNMLADPKKSYEIMVRSEADTSGQYYLNKWTPWATFGTYSQAKWGDELNESPKDDVFNEEKAFVEEINLAYNKAISHYKKHTGVDFPEDAYFSGHSYCKYFDQIDELINNMTMQYHVDYIISQRDMPGPKFHTTCTFYINDNYGGGDLEFFIDGEIINYKPEAGDIVVFPSTDPYYHGVKKIFDGNKFFVRNFVMTNYEGSAEWLENQRSMGAYRWAKKEFERIEKEDDHNAIYLSNGNRITFDEAQKIREEKLAKLNG